MSNVTKKKVLVYPCGTEIALEIYNSVCYSTKYDLYGGSSTYDHGRFVYNNHIDNLPFITDDSSIEDVELFIDRIKKYNFDFIYPSMDGVINVFSKYKEFFDCIIIAPEYETTNITRSKKQTYEKLKGIIPLPTIYSSYPDAYPVFVKPKIGQGSVGTKLINSKKELDKYINNENYLILEYLPGKEYTIDCFTDNNGKLVYSIGRTRSRIKNGISVNSKFVKNELFNEYAELINNNIKQRGGWFFQLKEDKDGKLKLLEVASRIAGTSGINRMIGANLPLSTVYLYDNINIDSFIINSYDLEIDRALDSTYRININYSNVYVDYDDTLIINGKINLKLIKFLFQCVNNDKKLFLLTKHSGDINVDLERFHLTNIFDKVIHIEKNKQKSDYIVDVDSIFIDDSFGERFNINKLLKIDVFDTHMIDCLMEN